MSSHSSDLVIKQLKLLAEVPIINIIRQISKQERSIERHSLDQAHEQEDHNEQPDCSSSSEKENQTMLSTSSKTKFQYQYLLIAVLILAVAIAIAVFQYGAAPSISVGQPVTQNLTTLSADEVSAYRWDAMAKFYAGQAPAAQNLTTLSAADVSAYRWDAIARFYAGQASPAANLSWPARPDFSVLNEIVDMPAFHYTAPGR